MRKYLNQINQIEQSIGVDDSRQNWLVKELYNGIFEVTRISAGNTSESTKKLTRSEFEEFRERVGNDRLIMVEWA